MTTLLILGAVGIAVILLSLVVGDLLDGIFDAIGGDFLSVASVGGFLGALGFGGAILLTLTNTWWIAIGAGIVLGLLVGAAAFWLTMKLKANENLATVRTGGLVGHKGHVIHDIPDGGFGTIRVRAAGAPAQLNAKAAEPIPAGTLIQIVEVTSPTSVVVRFAEPDAPGPVNPLE